MFSVKWAPPEGVRIGPLTVTQRAKLWHSSTYTVQWLENTFQACTTTPGKEAFEKWAKERFGSWQGAKLIASCNRRSKKGTWVTKHPPKTFDEKTEFMWNSAAGYYGVSLQALQAWHQYAADNNLFQPPRTKPPPKRRKGETSTQWMSLKLVDGHKLPIIDLEYARRTAIAEYDKTRDTLERWRTDSDLFYMDILERSNSIIVSRENEKLDPRNKELATIDDAFRTRINFLSMMHVAWRDAALLFEDLQALGLATPAAIERAYEQDTTLLWRLVSVKYRISAMTWKLWANFQQLVAVSEYYGPLFHRFRDKNGYAYIEPNRRAIDQLVKRNKLTVMDEIVLTCASTASPSPMTFFQMIESALTEDRSQEKKFSPAVFEAMGDLAAACEFESQFTRTEFSTRLIEYAGMVEAAGFDRIRMRSIMYYMDPDKLEREPPQYWDQAGEASRSIRELEMAWTHSIWTLSIRPILQVMRGLSDWHGVPMQNIEMPQDLFNEMWRQIDGQLWVLASNLDREAEEGRVAAEYGLWNPMDPERPVSSMYVFADIELQVVQGISFQPRSAPIYKQHIPVARPSDSVVQSGRAFVAAGGAESKSKTKTRGIGSAKEPQVIGGDATVDSQPSAGHGAPAIPSDIKLGKKASELFHRILEPSEEDKENVQAKGQIRWGDFENAMKRLGFDVVQTAGSSVRFDPPAPTARPITFHRPHPDSLLTPHAIKWSREDIWFQLRND
ncbi:hypothetical protein HMN09_00804000 [Mycena chlorophos]|uniref:Uncharacterized protein n=1 Tax=Mycena chlorophos TaxID=658473 RepID=A0A8H6SU43_MYCCL|nr:hypothetical protein HMN09_00804000 [Mycena chlorophos]